MTLYGGLKPEGRSERAPENADAVPRLEVRRRRVARFDDAPDDGLQEFRHQLQSRASYRDLTLARYQTSLLYTFGQDEFDVRIRGRLRRAECCWAV
jgi:hypothetical protein